MEQERAEQPAVITGSDVDLGEVLIQKGLLTPGQLDEARQLQQKTGASTGLTPALGRLLVEKGYLPSQEKLRSLGQETSALLYCSKCGAAYQVWYHNAASAYECPTCGGKLGKDAKPAPSPAADLQQVIQQRLKLLGGLSTGLFVGLVLLIILATRKDPARMIIQQANKHLAAKEWGLLEADVKQIEKISAKHPAIPFYRDKMAHHAAENDKKRKEWLDTVALLKIHAMDDVLTTLRAKFAEVPDMQEFFKSSVLQALAEVDGVCVADAQSVAGDGVPKPDWLKEDAKKRAQTALDRCRAMAALEKDALFPYKASPAIAATMEQLKRVVAYEGTWELRVNVAPYAEVVVRSGATVVEKGWTPLGKKGIEVGGGNFQVDLCWPSAADAKLKRTVDVTAVKNGHLVLVGGDLEAGRVNVQR
jgi:hypothetical protein